MILVNMVRQTYVRLVIAGRNTTMDFCSGWERLGSTSNRGKMGFIAKSQVCVSGWKITKMSSKREESDFTKPPLEFLLKTGNGDQTLPKECWKGKQFNQI